MINRIIGRIVLIFLLINLMLCNFNVKAQAHSNTIFENIAIKDELSKNSIVIYLLLCLIIIIIISNYFNKVKKLDDMVSERTYELSQQMEQNTKLFNKVIHLERNKNAYLVNISHEIRTPLNVLNSIQQLIRELNKTPEGITKEKLNHYMTISEKNIQRLLKLIDDLIDTSKIEHGNYNIEIKKNDIVYIVEEAALSLKDYVESKNIELIIDPAIEEKVIECDAVEIERCITNLVSNAAKFTDEGGSIIISVDEVDNNVKIEVSDTGIGIEEKYLKKIFDRFNQIIDSNCEVKGGSGLGLTITKHIVNLHHGKIYVESKVNKGSKFTIILPVSYKEDIKI